MFSRIQILDNVKDYSSRVTQKEYDLQAASGRSAHRSRLEQTITDLKTQMESEKALLQDLRTLRADTEGFDQPSSDPKVRLRQLSSIKGAYERMATASPSLPPSNSALPALLALRYTQRHISEAKSSIPKTHAALETARKRLRREQSDMSDNRILAETLEARIAKLRVSTMEKSQESPSEAARALVNPEIIRRESFEAETKKVTRALVLFINSTLALLLAAEELGGPVAGSVLDITDEMLVNGYNAAGKPRKTKSVPREDERQLRIDRIWGTQGEDEDSFEEQPRSEAEAAAKELRDLIEKLLELITEQGSGQYVHLERESAASRFLVRANVAMLHRNDARRIRLIDFGRDVEN